ncbi:division/cell wall cluster transcriptional repressor MraZ [Anaerofilum sp. BX8]|uniref:Transcriptional regulator MraZ n=1 Tax=Anaerofilum hominis TaxID=2763016 RepID=A0A923L1K2_9FIRM|nr:division/cell wall cluster transcriptional repressor MraZ [Anaerofilum hominis]MBC5581543.1 division/cell wall cluster transcriptional repressor MraZ [Anaerofilum hominis]
MLIGTYSQKLDEKGRLNFPVRFRDEMGDQFYVTCWLDECLIALPAARFEQIFARLTESGMVKNRGLRRMLYAGAVEAVPDKQGRILLPPPLREHAGLDKEVVVIGVGDCVELWDPARWKAMQDSMRSGDMAAAMEELDL